MKIFGEEGGKNVEFGFKNVYYSGRKVKRVR